MKPQDMDLKQTRLKQYVVFLDYRCSVHLSCAQAQKLRKPFIWCVVCWNLTGTHIRVNPPKAIRKL